jgi:hypothetical protein
VIGSVSQAVAEVCAIIPTLFPRREGYKARRAVPSRVAEKYGLGRAA